MGRPPSYKVTSSYKVDHTGSASRRYTGYDASLCKFGAPSRAARASAAAAASGQPQGCTLHVGAEGARASVALLGARWLARQETPEVVAYLGPRANGTRETDTASALAIKCGRWEGKGARQPKAFHTSSPGSNPSAASERRFADEPELTIRANFLPKRAAMRRSNSSVRGPGARKPSRSAAITAEISSSP